MSRLWDETVHMPLLGRDGKNADMIHKFKRRKFHLRVLLQGNCVHIIVLAKSPQGAAHKLRKAPYMMPSMAVPPPSRANPSRRGIA
jgi:hypothetical protein